MTYEKMSINKKKEHLKSFADSFTDIKNKNIIKLHLKKEFSVEAECHVIAGIVDKIIEINNNLINDNSYNMITLSSNFRYILETMISTELLLKEPEYKFRIYLSLHLHNKEKHKKIIERLKSEIVILEKLESEEKKSLELLRNSNIEKSDRMEKYQEVINHFIRLAYENPMMFLEGVKENTFWGQLHMLKTKMLPKYESDLQEIENKMLVLSKQLSKSPEINSLFNINRQQSKVFKEIPDNRSWEVKASIVGLQSEYKFFYDYTSALMHFTSYSILTKHNLDNGEVFLLYNMIVQYVTKIYDNIIKIVGLENIELIVID